MRVGARTLALLLLVVAAGASFASSARADGDPGSDVLVFQDLFVNGDAGVSVAQQVQLGDLLTAAGRSGFPVRVAIISSPYDLGAITALWQRPQAYARFLGIELSLAYKQRLLVVMPDGFGFNWPGHSAAPAYRLLAKIPIGPGGSGLVAAARTAVRRLSAGAGVRLGAPAPVTSGAVDAAPPAAGATATPARTGGSDDGVLVVVALVAALAAIALTGRAVLRQRGRVRAATAGEASGRRRRAATGHLRLGAPGFALLVALAAGASILAVSVLAEPGVSQTAELAGNPNLDPGTALSSPAPGFTLSDQFGQPVSLRSFRGKVVLLAFNDSECTTVCPLTTTAMLDAKAMLGAAGSQVQLLGIDANPAATAIDDVWSYSELHGMLHSWHFLTGSLPQLERIWKAYGVEAEIQHGLTSHTPALFMIDPLGRLRKLYVVQQSYAAVGQLGAVLAREASSLLASHPSVRTTVSYAQIPGIDPSTSVVLPRAGGGNVRLGQGGSAHLYMFFATWDQEVTSLGGHLDALNQYRSSAGSAGLPALTAVDEGSVEPSQSSLPTFLGGLSRPLAYPVAIDRSGRVADGYEVQGVPWFVLVSPTGRILWYWEVSTSGWLSRDALAANVRAALAREPNAPQSAAVAAQELAGSPPPLAALHEQAGRLLGSESQLTAQVRALRGYPIVINAWASWCTPCRSEFGLFASASAQYGRQVAFLGADTNDSPGDARSFLTQHPVSYPSYQASMTGIQSIVPAGLEGLPTTIFIDRAGKIAYVHDGQYDSQGTLDEDIGNYASGG